MNLHTGLTSFTNINSKWIINLNIKCKTVKLLEDNIGKNLDDLGYGHDFFWLCLTAHQTGALGSESMES